MTHPAPHRLHVPARAGRRLAALCGVLAILLLAHAVVAAVVATGPDGQAVAGRTHWLPVVTDALAALVCGVLAAVSAGTRPRSGHRQVVIAVVIGVAIVAAAQRGAWLQQPWQAGEIAVLVVLAGAGRIGRRVFGTLATLGWLAAGIAVAASARDTTGADLASTALPLTLTLVAATVVATSLQAARAETTRELAAAHREAQEAAVRDPLTHAANRQGLEMVAVPIIDYARRQGQALHCLVVDVDEFSAVNDTAGYSGGDAVLMAVAEALRGCVRGTDVVARWDGDRFVIFGPGTGTSPLELERRVATALVEDPPVSTPWSQRVSVGSATLVPWDDGDLDALLRRGEQDLDLRRSLRRRAGLVAAAAAAEDPGRAGLGGTGPQSVPSGESAATDGPA